MAGARPDGGRVAPLLDRARRSLDRLRQPVVAPNGCSDGVDLAARVGSVRLPSPVMTASGTAGHGVELGRYVELSSLGAVVSKSLAPGPWAGNPAPRVHETPAGMLNSVGLQGPGVPRWLEHELPGLLDAGATVVASVWGQTVDEFAAAAEALAGAPPEVVAVEVNVSCPNLHDGSRMFSHSPTAAAEAVAATALCGRPRWAKLSPNGGDLLPVVDAVVEAGAEAVTLVNTVMGLDVDTERWQVRLGGRGGGLSGPAIRPVALRAVHTVAAARPDVPVVGVGGIARGAHAAAFLLVGASAVQVGTASFADPRACGIVARELHDWCRHHGVTSLDEVIGAVHER
ncbi:MAG: dihydroorotate dehydrogenase [Acidimicrobiia bacterium]|nr:dihydroorotate dehydrogenase [Acidimicrobiia bacterium]